MDPSLLRERNSFKRKAVSMLDTAPAQTPKRRASQRGADTVATPTRGGDTGAASSVAPHGGAARNQYRFGVLARLVRHMKQRHADGSTHALTLEEMLDETGQQEVGARTKQWLAQEALVNNPKLRRNGDGLYQFKPALDVRDRKSLLRLLRRCDLRGEGGLLVEDVRESVPHAERVLKQIAGDTVCVTRPQDKRQVLFYRDGSMQFCVDEAFVRLWRGVCVRGVDDDKIEEYLSRQGLQAMQTTAVGAARTVLRQRGARGGRRVGRRDTRVAVKDNEHVKDVLQEYEV